MLVTPHEELQPVAEWVEGVEKNPLKSDGSLIASCPLIIAKCIRFASEKCS
jgi:hypothetical protein